jgi:hypothetical protein
MAEDQRPEEVQRWTAKRRAALVISLLKGETTAIEAARRHGLKVAEVEEWRDRFLLGAGERTSCSPERRRSAARRRNQSAQAQGGRADHGPGHSARGGEAPYDAGDVRRVIVTLPGVSMRRVCRVLKFSRARLRARAVIAAAPPRLDEVLAERIQCLIEAHPTFGYRRYAICGVFVDTSEMN